MKSKKSDGSTISTLKENGYFKLTLVNKAEALSSQFLAFTGEGNNNLPSLISSKVEPIPDVQITDREIL